MNEGNSELGAVAKVTVWKSWVCFKGHSEKFLEVGKKVLKCLLRGYPLAYSPKLIGEYERGKTVVNKKYFRPFTNCEDVFLGQPLKRPHCHLSHTLTSSLVSFIW